jgi:hypothetical protein
VDHSDSRWAAELFERAQPLEVVESEIVRFEAVEMRLTCVIESGISFFKEAETFGVAESETARFEGTESATSCPEEMRRT